MLNADAPMSLRWLSESQRNRLCSQVHDAITAVVSQWGMLGRESTTYVEFTTEQDNHSASACYYLFNDTTPIAALRTGVDALRQLLHLPASTHFTSRDTDSFLAQLETDLADAILRRVVGNNLEGTLTTRRVEPSENPCLRVGRVRYLFNIGCGHNHSPCAQLEFSPAL